MTTEATTAATTAGAALAYRFYEDMLNRRQLDLAEEILAPDSITHSTVGGPGGAGPDAVRAVDQHMRAGFPDLNFHLDQVIAEGDTVAVRWTMTGTHTGPFFDHEPTGNPVSVRGNVFFTTRDGKITDIWPVIDIHGLHQQIGMR